MEMTTMPILVTVGVSRVGCLVPLTEAGSAAAGQQQQHQQQQEILQRSVQTQVLDNNEPPVAVAVAVSVAVDAAETWAAAVLDVDSIEAADEAEAGFCRALGMARLELHALYWLRRLILLMVKLALAFALALAFDYDWNWNRKRLAESEISEKEMAEDETQPERGPGPGAREKKEP